MPERLPKDVVLLQLALVLLAGEELSYERLADDFRLERRTAERYLHDLRAAGLPILDRRVDRQAVFALDRHRTRLTVEAIDVPPAAARSLSLLIVAAALLPANLGVREAVDRTVRAALRVRGMKAATELRRLEDAVLVLENDAKDYRGREQVFSTLVDATLAGHLVEAHYQSPKTGSSLERFWPATIGLYKGGLYALAISEGDDGDGATWRALERFIGTPVIDEQAPKLDGRLRLRALDEAQARWGPARPRGREQIITLHFSKVAAAYVRARPWHKNAELADWDDGGVRMSLRLRGETLMFESWVKSWGKEVQVLRPHDMAERVAHELEEAALAHRRAAAEFAAFLAGGD